MKIYLIRHGESEGNIGQLVQSTEEPLTTIGVQQARLVSKRFISLPIDIILSSPEIRAKQTAEILAAEINTPIEISDLLIEATKPSVILKKPKDDPEVTKIKRLLKDNFHTSGWKYSDEENFNDLRRRASTLLSKLLLRNESNIVLITHGIFMRMIVAVAIMGDQLTSHEYWKFFVALDLANTGITVMRSNISKKYADASTWELVTWNDQDHLNEIKQ